MKLKFGDAASIRARDEGILLDRLKYLHDSLSTGPWKADINENIGKNWLVATMGYSNIDEQTYILTTKNVRASELDGDAKTDAEGLAELRNLLPRLIEALDMREQG